MSSASRRSCKMSASLRSFSTRVSIWSSTSMNLKKTQSKNKLPSVRPIYSLSSKCQQYAKPTFSTPSYPDCPFAAQPLVFANRCPWMNKRHHSIPYCTHCLRPCHCLRVWENVPKNCIRKPVLIMFLSTTFRHEPDGNLSQFCGFLIVAAAIRLTHTSFIPFHTADFVRSASTWYIISCFLTFHRTVRR